MIYIAGYGRSGSTVVELALVNSLERCIGLGELSMLPRYYVDHRDELSDDWIRAHEEAVAGCGWSTDELLSYHRRIHRFPVLFMFCRREYKDYWSSVIRYWSSKADIIVDSSKTAYLDYLMPRVHADQCDVDIIFLKRNYSGVLSSFRRGDNERLRRNQPADYSYPLARSFIGWCFANLAARVTTRGMRTHKVNWDGFREDLLEHGRTSIGPFVIDKKTFSKTNYYGFAGNRLIDESQDIILE